MREGNDDHLHARQLEKTGFWGAQGAGVIYAARTTGRFLVAHRSRHVEQPGTWGTNGGAIDRGENPREGAKREGMEETGYEGPVEMVPLFVFEHKNAAGDVDFRYSNFLGIIPDEFEPEPFPDAAWETQGFRWCEYGQWPAPLHFGFKAVLSDPASAAAMREFAEKAKVTNERTGPAQS